MQSSAPTIFLGKTILSNSDRTLFEKIVILNPLESLKLKVSDKKWLTMGLKMWLLSLWIFCIRHASLLQVSHVFKMLRGERPGQTRSRLEMHLCTGRKRVNGSTHTSKKTWSSTGDFYMPNALSPYVLKVVSLTYGLLSDGSNKIAFLS